jgi:quinol monooxygenase YgiN
MIIVAGSLTAHPGKRDELVEQSKEAVVAARKAKGCHAFVVAADLVDGDKAVVFERWENRECLSAFRGNGPDSGIGSLIAGFDVREFEVVEG